jgi:hypothetical protein
MTTFTINETNEIVAFSSQEEAAAATATPFDSFSSQKELVELAKAWPAERLVSIFNSLTGVTPVESFKSTKAAVARIWERIKSLGEPEQPQAEQAAKPKAGKKGTNRAQSAKGAPAKGKATKKATPAKKAPKAKKTARAKEGGGPREGSKMAQVIAMLSRSTPSRPRSFGPPILVLTHGAKAIEIEDIEARVAELERAAEEAKKTR